MMKKNLSILAISFMSTVSLTNMVACENKGKKNYDYKLLLTIPNKSAYRLQFDNNNNWYITSNTELIIGKNKTIINTINIKDLILTIFINQKNNDWYVGTVNGNIYTGNIESKSFEKLINGQGIENYSLYCDKNNDCYAGYSNGDILEINKNTMKLNFLKNVKDYVLSINNYNNQIIFGLGNGQIWCYKINDKSWTVLKTFKSEQIYNIIENNNIIYVLTSKNNIYKFKNHLWNTKAHFSKNIIQNITIDSINNIYTGNNIGDVYKVDNEKITKILNINNINIVDIKENQNNLYILSGNGQLYKIDI